MKPCDKCYCLQECLIDCPAPDKIFKKDESGVCPYWFANYCEGFEQRCPLDDDAPPVLTEEGVMDNIINKFLDWMRGNL